MLDAHPATDDTQRRVSRLQPPDLTVVCAPILPPEHLLPSCARPHVREHSAPYPTEPVPRLETAPGSVFVAVPPTLYYLRAVEYYQCV